MANENIDGQVIQRGLEARDVLAFPGFESVLDELLQEQWLLFLSTDPYDEKGREKVHSYAVSIQGIKTKLENWVSEGKRLSAQRGDEEDGTGNSND